MTRVNRSGGPPESGPGERASGARSRRPGAPSGPSRMGSRMWSAGKIVALIAALLTTYAVFAAASVRLALRAREVTVPDLTNRTTSEASAISAPLGLTLREDELRRPD